MTRIVAVRSAFPGHRYPQADITAQIAEVSGLRPAQRALLERLHANAGVEFRHTVLPLPDYGSLHGVEPVNDAYIRTATDLGEQALRRALAQAGLAGADLDLLIVTSVTGGAVPSLDARLMPRLGLRPAVKRLPIVRPRWVGGRAGGAGPAGPGARLPARLAGPARRPARRRGLHAEPAGHPGRHRGPGRQRPVRRRSGGGGGQPRPPRPRSPK